MVFTSHTFDRLCEGRVFLAGVHELQALSSSHVSVQGPLEVYNIQWHDAAEKKVFDLNSVDVTTFPINHCEIIMFLRLLASVSVCCCVAGGPLSISRELAAAFQLEGVREVAVRMVDRAEVGLDLMEVRFKVRS